MSFEFKTASNNLIYIINNGFSRKDFNVVKEDPIKMLLDELLLEVFSHLNLAERGKICSVSNRWNRLAKEPNAWKNTICRALDYESNYYDMGAVMNVGKRMCVEESFLLYIRSCMEKF